MKIFCITVPELEGEREAAQKHFDERQVPVEFIRGIHGVKSGIATTLPYEFDNPGSGFNVGPKIISLCINHMLAWTACSVLPDDMFLILESDAKFEPDWFVRLNNALLDAPPDWDVIFIGSCNCKGKPMTHIKGDVYQIDTTNPHHMPQCSHATLYNKRAINMCIDTQRKLYTGIDLALIFHTLPHLKVLTVLPRIADQHGINIEP